MPLRKRDANALPFLTKTEGHAHEEEIIGLAWPE
jgi:hypothetical protein